VVFDPSALVDGGTDRAFALARSGPVVLFHRPEVLGAEVDLLRRRGYACSVSHCATWRDLDDQHDALVSALGLPGHYGRNLDALADCLSDVVVDAVAGGVPGTVLGLTGWDGWSRRETDAAQGLLDVLAAAAHDALLLGHVLLVLLQSDDPRLQVPPVGARTVGWNPSEWRTADRRA
jgi:hypothetical protein